MVTVAKFLIDQGDTRSDAAVRALFGACVGAYVMGSGKKATVELLTELAGIVAQRGDAIIDEFETFKKDREAKRRPQ
jgi:hypothetical protein